MNAFELVKSVFPTEADLLKKSIWHLEKRVLLATGGLLFLLSLIAMLHVIYYMLLIRTMPDLAAAGVVVFTDLVISATFFFFARTPKKEQHDALDKLSMFSGYLIRGAFALAILTISTGLAFHNTRRIGRR